MCKSMNALFCPFMDKEQESSFWTNCSEVQIKKKEDRTMVDELTQESFQTGKAIVTVSVDLITG